MLTSYLTLAIDGIAAVISVLTLVRLLLPGRVTWQASRDDALRDLQSYATPVRDFSRMLAYPASLRSSGWFFALWPAEFVSLLLLAITDPASTPAAALVGVAASFAAPLILLLAALSIEFGVVAAGIKGDPFRKYFWADQTRGLVLISIVAPAAWYATQFVRSTQIELVATPVVFWILAASFLTWMTLKATSSTRWEQIDAAWARYREERGGRIGRAIVHVKGNNHPAESIEGPIMSIGRRLEVKTSTAIERIPWDRIDWLTWVGEPTP